MAESKFDFQNEIQIDLDALHEEWRTHANTRYKYASEVSYLDRVLKKIGEEIATVKAGLIKECKNENAKATVQQIDAFCIENKSHITVKEKQIDAEYELNMAKNALRAFDDRKTALENEVKLWGGNYYSSPTEERKIESSKPNKSNSSNNKSIAMKGKEEATKKARTGMNQKRIRK